MRTIGTPIFTAFTDDTVMTIAVAEALMGAPDNEEVMRQRLIQSMQKWGHRYPGAGYGLRFSDWLDSVNPQPYNSWGNGSAMRVSSVAWLYDDLDTVRRMARLSAEVTHNHPEGIKGAEATASAIFLARTGSSKAEIKAYVEKQFGYDLSRTCDEIRPDYHHVESCQESQTNSKIFTEYNEVGFSRGNIRSITAIGESTKNHLLRQNAAKIGEKGVGFKTIFAIASRVAIHSGEYHFSLADKSPTIPDLLAGPFEPVSGTQMVLSIKDGVQLTNYKEQDILELCLCLRKLRKITINSTVVTIEDNDSSRKRFEPGQVLQAGRKKQPLKIWLRFWQRY